MFEKGAKVCPLGRAGEGIDIAKGIWFLANNDDSAFMTGQFMNMCGGTSVPSLTLL